MGFLNLLNHLLSFVAPAVVVALLVTLAAPLVLPRTARPAGWWVRFAINCAAGVLALAVGLWSFGRDGKIATYAGLVLAVASAQWLAARAWRG